jgi:adenylyl-sulfate kinase
MTDATVHHIHPEQGAQLDAEHAEQLRDRGVVLGGFTLWFTGLSGAGKSTIADLVAAELRKRHSKIEVLDGDVIRTNLSKGLGFSREDRDANIRRIAFVADLLSRNGVPVITAAISPYKATRDEARMLMGERFIEVYVKASLDTCVERDVKGLYKKALAGEIEHFTGVSDPYEPPSHPELVLDTEAHSAEQSAQLILGYLESRGLIPAGNHSSGGGGSAGWPNP